MNDYSGSLALQVTGLRVPRPLAAAAAAAGQGQYEREQLFGGAADRLDDLDGEHPFSVVTARS
ncbi:hypothetical protein, partial [Streptomyces lydicus]|uniref:hypothetical protein n=1 Tax=Streptomyces lydicus TaxID=47763 RepID=UPI00332F3E3B